MGGLDHDLSEREIQKEVMDMLLSHPKVIVVSQQDSNRTKGRKFGAGKYKPKGQSDIIFMWKDGAKYGAIELKAKGGKASEEQLAFLQKVKDGGGLSLLAFSLAEVKDFLNEASKIHSSNSPGIQKELR